MTAIPAQIAQSPQELEKIVRRVTEISTLPHVAKQIVDVIARPDSGAADLRAVLETDPALSTRVLRCVNSAAYGLRTRITNLQLAVTYLGFKEVRNLALTASVAEIFRHDEPLGLYRRPALWRHSVCVAIGARMIAMRLKMPNFEEAFLAGLLHDVGIVMEDQYCHAAFARMMLTLHPDVSLLAAEQQALGFDHTIVGARVAEAWKFPPEVVLPIRYHHGCQAYHGDHENLVAIVELSNLICTMKGIGSVAARPLRPNMAAVTRLGLSREDVKVFAADLDPQLAAGRELMTLCGTRGGP